MPAPSPEDLGEMLTQIHKRVLRYLELTHMFEEGESRPVVGTEDSRQNSDDSVVAGILDALAIDAFLVSCSLCVLSVTLTESGGEGSVGRCRCWGAAEVLALETPQGLAPHEGNHENPNHRHQGMDEPHHTETR